LSDSKFDPSNSADRLARGFANNDAQVLEEIYLKNFPTVRNYILKNSGTEDDAKDIYQEAVINAWINARDGKFEAKSQTSPGAYIYQIARYKWLDKLKSKKHRSTVRLADEDNHLPAEEEVMQIEERQERIDYSVKLYNELGGQCKQVLKMFYFEKRNLHEIANELEKEPGSIRTIKYRCMMKLRNLHQSLQKKESERNE